MELLWEGGPLLEQSPSVFRLGTDSLLLADFACPDPHAKILDLGTGSGLLLLLLLWDKPAATAAAIDILPEACVLAQRNLERNGLGDRTIVRQADLRHLEHIVTADSFDVVISNPPYFAEGTGAIADGSFGIARSEQSCTLKDLCAAAAFALRRGGAFYMVHRPERLCELFMALSKSGLEPKRIRPVHHSPEYPVNLLLIEARNGGAPGLIWDPDLYLFCSDGSESSDYRRICHRL